MVDLQGQQKADEEENVEVESFLNQKVSRLVHDAIESVKLRSEEIAPLDKDNAVKPKVAETASSTSNTRRQKNQQKKVKG